MKQQKLCINTSIMPFLFLSLSCSTKSLPYMVFKLNPRNHFHVNHFHAKNQQIDARNHFHVKGQKFGIPYLLTSKTIICKVLKKLQKSPPEELHLNIINLFNIITALSIIPSFFFEYLLQQHTFFMPLGGCFTQAFNQFLRSLLAGT